MLTIEPAKMEDLARLQPTMPRAYWRRAVVQLARSTAWTIEDGGELLAMGGLWPEPDFFDLWLWIAPQVRGGGKGRALTRMLIRLADALPADVPIAVSVKAGHRPGLRLAKLTGFEEVGSMLDGRLIRFLRRRPPLTGARRV